MLFLLDIFKNKETCQEGREILDVLHKEREADILWEFKTLLERYWIKRDVGHVVLTSS